MTSQLGGAPLGNQNARKHGLYSQRAAVPETPPAADLNPDIANLRAYMQRLVDVYADTRVPEEVAFVLRQLTVASLGLTRLVRTQLFANPPEPPRDEVLDQIGSAAEEIRQQMEPTGQVQCPNCRQTTSLLALSHIAAACHLTGQPHLDFAFRPGGRLVNIPEYQDELARCLGQDFADRQVIPRPDISVSELNDISAAYYLDHPESLPAPRLDDIPSAVTPSSPQSILQSSSSADNSSSSPSMIPARPAFPPSSPPSSLSVDNSSSSASPAPDRGSAVSSSRLPSSSSVDNSSSSPTDFPAFFASISSAGLAKGFENFIAASDDSVWDDDDDDYPSEPEPTLADLRAAIIVHREKYKHNPRLANNPELLPDEEIDDIFLEFDHDQIQAVVRQLRRESASHPPSPP